MAQYELQCIRHAHVNHSPVTDDLAASDLTCPKLSSVLMPFIRDQSQTKRYSHCLASSSRLFTTF